MDSAAMTTGTIIAILCIGALTGLFFFLKWLTNRGKTPIKGEAETEIKTDTEVETETEGGGIQIGQGTSPCYVIRKTGIFEASTIKEPMGHTFIADPSMGQYGLTGPCSLLVETDNDVAVYDPRQDAYQAADSPFMAWLAIHWEIVKEVFKTARPWWQSAPLWVAMLVLALLFIAILVFGGG